MLHAVTIHGPGAEPERTIVATPLVAGGSRADALFLAGAPPAAFRLLPRPPGLVLESAAAGLRACGQALPPGARRLLRPGERAELMGFAVEVELAHPCDGSTRVAAAALLIDAAAGSDPVAGAHLVVLTGPGAGERHALADGRTIGRGRSSGIRLHDPRASRVHARVRLEPGGASIEDLRSRNGLRVNGVRVERGPRPIRHGDELLIGDTALALVDPGAPAEGACAPIEAGARRRIRSRRAAALLLALSAAALALAGP